MTRTISGTLTPNSPLLLARPISMWIGFANAFVAALVSFKLLPADDVQTAYWMAGINAVFALIAAWAVRPFPIPLLSTAFVSLGTIAIAYGTHVTGNQIGVLNGLLVMAGAMFTYTQVSPEPAIDPAVIK